MIYYFVIQSVSFLLYYMQKKEECLMKACVIGGWEQNVRDYLFVICIN